MYGAHTDDLAERGRNIPHAATQKFARCLTRAQELSGQIHADDTPPLFQRHLVEWRVALNPRVVHQNVDRAESLAYFREHGTYVLFVAHVRLHGDRLQL